MFSIKTISKESVVQQHCPLTAHRTAGLFQPYNGVERFLVGIEGKEKLPEANTRNSTLETGDVDEDFCDD